VEKDQKLFINTMKEKLTLLLNFIFISVFSQYTFDYKFNVKSVYNNSEYITQIFINSENPGYELYYYHNNDIRLFDGRKSCTYNFREKLKNGEKIYKYINKGCYSNSEGTKKIGHIEITEYSNNIFIIKSFSSKIEKESNLELKVVLEEAEDDLLCLYKLDVGNVIRQKLLTAFREVLVSTKGNSNYIINKLEASYKNGFPTKTTDLVKVEETNMILNLKRAGN